MGLRINTNVLAIAAQHRLQKSTGKLSTSLERLSSGLRINSGKDDVVGLLKSESLRSQIRGIAASEANLANAQNLLGVAEGSLAQLTEISQRIRENVVTASDESISASDRDNLTTSINDLLEEYNRLAQASEFDGVKLLTGTFTAKSFQVGPNADNQVSFSISDARSSAIGKVAILTAETLTASTADGSDPAFGDPANIEINGEAIATAAFTDDGVSSAEGDESAIAYVNAINSISGVTGVSASVLATEVTISYNGGDNIDALDQLEINGVAVAQAAYASDDTGMGSLANAINSIATQTGVTATIDATANTVVLEASDGRNIQITLDNGITTSRTSLLGTFSAPSAADVSYLFRGGFKLSSDDAFDVAGASAEFATSDAVTGNLSNSSTLSNLSVATAEDAQEGIFILDNVIRQLQQKRADVGSKSIRFSVAEAELQVRKENLTSSESRIRDADVAAETANLTGAQILQQAGVSVLSRANAVPQIALSLLQG